MVDHLHYDQHNSLRTTERPRTFVFHIFADFVSRSGIKALLLSHLLFHLGPWRLSSRISADRLSTRRLRHLV